MTTDEKLKGLLERNYYIPDVSELFIGFEYSYKSGLNIIHRTIEDRFSLEFTFTLLLDDNLFVKKLDVKDIESLEWKHKDKSIDEWFEKLGEFDMGSWTAYKLILHYGLHDNRLVIYADDSGEDFHLFRGVIKNKSELRRLFKQLNIC